MTWRKSTYSGGASSSCVEVGDGRRQVMIRDTKQQHLGDARTVLSVSPDAWRTFITSVRR